MTADQLALAQELARREPPIIQEIVKALRDQSLERYYIALLERHQRGLV